jgi:hypothetical protein
MNGSSSFYLARVNLTIPVANTFSKAMFPIQEPFITYVLSIRAIGSIALPAGTIGKKERP